MTSVRITPKPILRVSWRRKKRIFQMMIVKKSVNTSQKNKWLKIKIL